MALSYDDSGLAWGLGLLSTNEVEHAIRSLGLNCVVVMTPDAFQFTNQSCILLINKHYILKFRFRNRTYIFDSAGEMHLRALGLSMNPASYVPFRSTYQLMTSQMCGQFCLFVLCVLKNNPRDIVEAVNLALPNAAANEFLMMKFTLSKKIGEEFYDARYRNVLQTFDAFIN